MVQCEGIVSLAMPCYILKETNLKIKHQRKAAYKQLFSDALPFNSYGEALHVKNERFCQLFKLTNKGMNQ